MAAALAAGLEMRSRLGSRLALAIWGLMSAVSLGHYVVDAPDAYAIDVNGSIAGEGGLALAVAALALFGAATAVSPAATHPPESDRVALEPLLESVTSSDAGDDEEGSGSSRDGLRRRSVP